MSSVIPAPERKTGSQGKQCAAFDCTSREYCIIEGDRVSSGISFFKFPKDKLERELWCRLIKRKDGKDGFNVTTHTVICDKHFEKAYLSRPPGGTRVKRLEGGKPVLHPWNDFDLYVRRRPYRERQPLNTTTASRIKTSTSTIQLQEEMEICTDTDTGDNLIDIDALKTEMSTLKVKVLELTEKNNELTEKLQKAMSVKALFVDHISESDKACNHYTGFDRVEKLNSVFSFLDPGTQGENVIMRNYVSLRESGDSSRGRQRKLSPYEAFLLVLCRLRRNFSISHLGYLFQISESTVSNSILTWLNFIFMRFGTVCIWPTREKIKSTMPQSMKDKFPSVRAIIDCAEFKVEVPSSLFLHKMMYSEYKSHTTVKVLLAIAPGGGFTFISPVYPGSISDKEIVAKSGFLNPKLWTPGDSVMADRGFLITEYLEPMGVELTIPSFLKGRDQLSPEEVIQTQQIAAERIHVERMIQRLKSYHIFDRVIPINMLGSIDQLITVCAILSNYQPPIIASAESKVTN